MPASPVPRSERAARPVRVEAVLFDMDGVVTDTARVHAAAWKHLFDDFLKARAGKAGAFQPFDVRADYLAHVDGRPRLDGVRGFLAARAIELPEGAPDDPPGHHSVAALGALKNRYFSDWLARERVQVFPGTVALIRELRRRGVRTGLFTSSRNAAPVLESAGANHLFDVRVDGRLMLELGLAGKPDPALLLEAARRLGVPPAAAAVIEDASAGTEAGRRGGFGLVVGVDRGGNAEALLEHGADLVVQDLAELVLDAEGSLTVNLMSRLPLVFEHEAEVRGVLNGRRIAVFLDYDGTLTPIVDDPDEAWLDEPMRARVARLAAVAPSVLVSGRAVAVVRRLSGLDDLIVAGSHGFEIEGPGGLSDAPEAAADALPDLDRAERELEAALAGIPGHGIERKPFALEIHYRRVADADAGRLKTVVDEVAARHPRLRMGVGKKVVRLQPDIDWDKGRAVLHLLERLGLGGDDVLPVYVGDDVTDEDAFRALAGRGLAIAVQGEEDRPTGARYAVRDTGEVARLLDLLAEHAGGSAR